MKQIDPVQLFLVVFLGHKQDQINSMISKKTNMNEKTNKKKLKNKQTNMNRSLYTLLATYGANAVTKCLKKIKETEETTLLTSK